MLRVLRLGRQRSVVLCYFRVGEKDKARSGTSETDRFSTVRTWVIMVHAASPRVLLERCWCVFIKSVLATKS